MRLNASFEIAQNRMQRPGIWGAVLLFGGLWNLLRLGPGPGASSLDGFLLPFLLGAAILVLAPLPWLWTGDDRPSAPFAQGLGQALVWNLIMISPVVALMPLGPEHPMMMGRGMRMGPPMPSLFFLTSMHWRVWILGVASLCFGVLMGRTLAEQEGERIRADKAETRAREAQTRALQAQMNPHVLFNAISGLAELAREDSTSTEEALVKLADLLRRLLEHAGQTLAPLSQERALVEGLLALEQFRLGDRLKVTWVWDPTLEALLLPPLLLQPLVENAIKHGIAPCRSGGELEIGLSGNREAVRLWVANTGLPLQDRSPQGTGLTNLRQRLALMPGEPGRLEIRSSKGRTLAELHIQPRDQPMEAGHA